MRTIYLFIFESIILCEGKRLARNEVALYRNSKHVNIIADGKELSKSIKNSGMLKLSLRLKMISVDVAHLVQFHAITCGHCHEFAPIYEAFAKSIANWRCMIKVAGFECAGNNYGVCHREPFWIGGYPNFRLFAAYDTTHKNGGTRVKYESESKTGLTKECVDFLTENAPQRWIFSSPKPELNFVSARDFAKIFMHYVDTGDSHPECGNSKFF